MFHTSSPELSSFATAYKPQRKNMLSSESMRKAFALPLSPSIVWVHSKEEGVVLPAASSALTFATNGVPSSDYPPDLKAISFACSSESRNPPTTNPPSLVKATLSTPDPVP